MKSFHDNRVHFLYLFHLNFILNTSYPSPYSYSNQLKKKLFKKCYLQNLLQVFVIKLAFRERDREREREINIVQEQWVLKGSDSKD